MLQFISGCNCFRGQRGGALAETTQLHSKTSPARLFAARQSKPVAFGFGEDLTETASQHDAKSQQDPLPAAKINKNTKEERNSANHSRARSKSRPSTSKNDATSRRSQSNHQQPGQSKQATLGRLITNSRTFKANLRLAHITGVLLKRIFLIYFILTQGASNIARIFIDENNETNRQ